jgi:glycosyltransferase involved in cell wall biosynthesis
VIAYGHGGAKETIIEGETGMFFAEQTPAALAQAVRAFRSDDFDPSRLRAHARRYDRPLFKQQLDRTIRDLIGMPATP